MQRRSFAISVLAGASILAASCGGGEGGDALPPNPEPGPSPGPAPGPVFVAHAYVAMPASAEVAVYGVLGDGTLEAIGAVPAESGTSVVAVHRSGRFACAVNTTARTVTTYDRDPVAGSLRLKSSTEIELFGDPLHFKFHPTEDVAYVATGSNVGVYSVNLETGALQFVRSGARGPTGMDIHPSGTYLFVGRDLGFLESYRTDDQLQTLVNSVEAGQGELLAEVAVSLSGAFVYVSGRDGSIATHGVDPLSGAVGAPTLISVGNAGGPFAIHPSGLFAYAAAELNEQRGVVRLAMDPETGVLSDPVFHQATDALVLSLAISPSGRFIYAVNSATNTVSAFSINESTGALTRIGAPMDLGGSPASVCIIEL